MAASMQERKAAQRARPDGYAKSREADWKRLHIRDASFTSYQAKLILQNYHYPVCGRKINNRAPLDHDHITGFARGVVCNRCNLLLGQIETIGTQFLQSASAYLANWGANNE